MKVMMMMVAKHNVDNDGVHMAVRAAGNAWCCTASMKPNAKDGNDVVEIQKVNGYSSSDDCNCPPPFAQILEPTSSSNETSTHESAEMSTSRSSSSSSPSSLLLLDLTTCPDWMQFIEFKEDRRQDEGGAGTYDTLRCDLILSSPNDSDHTNKQTEDSQRQWRIWGRDFHLQRLEKSFASLVAAAHHGNQQQNAAFLKSGAVERAIQDSHRILESLLVEAAASPMLNPKLQHQQQQQQQELDATVARTYFRIQLIKFTWLWSLSKPKADDSNNNNNEQGSNNDCDARYIVVSGHACSSAKPMQIHCPITPIVATIAAHATRQKDNDDDDDAKSSISWSLDASLPTRHGDNNDDDDHGGAANPQQKVASWTRMRKKLEHGEHTYKPIGFPNAEVLMVRKSFNDKGKDDEFEILEGISSNFFAIYKNGTIKTATKGVLYGYARQLVLDIVEQQSNGSSSVSSSVSSLGLRFVDEPILLSESSEWVETFITSSSRLIYPISHILLRTTPIPTNKNGNNPEAAASNDIDDEILLPAGFEPFWCDPVLTRSQQEEHQTSTFVKPKWQVILDEILRRNGYP